MTQWVAFQTFPSVYVYAHTSFRVYNMMLCVWQGFAPLGLCAYTHTFWWVTNP